MLSRLLPVPWKPLARLTPGEARCVHCFAGFLLATSAQSSVLKMSRSSDVTKPFIALSSSTNKSLGFPL